MRTTTSIVSFTPAPPLDVADGLLGWLDLEVAGLVVIHGVALRRSRRGELALSWPAKNDSLGNRRAVVRPLDDRARVAVERQVLRELQLRRIAS